MKAIIMAGGKGTRLKPLTCSLPKPMVPVMNKPVMAYSIELLKKYGITEIGVTLAYMATTITDYFGTGEKWGVNLHYFIEEVPLGTGGSVRNAGDFVDETLIIVSGDALTDLDIQKALEFHREKQSKATLVLRNEEVPIEYGVVITNEAGQIIRFLEKPSWGEVFSNTINTGIYILEPEVLNYFSRGDVFDFSKDLFPKLLQDQVPMYGYVMEDYWCDIGDLNSYKDTHDDILAGKVNLPQVRKELEEGIWIAEGTTLGDGVKLHPPIYIGGNCSIGDGVEITGPTVIGRNCIIGKDTTIKRSILWKQTTLGEGVSLRGAVVCHQADLKNRVKVLENSIIGEGTIASSGVVVKPDVKIWPHKKIEENTTVNQNLIWGSKATKTLFGFRDISGDMNIELTPEFAARLGAAFSSSLKEDPRIIISSDTSNGARLIQRAMVAGITSTGAQAIDIKESFLPMTRFAVKYFGATGGVHVRASQRNQNKLNIEFIDGDGGNISRGMEREIENLFNREDFKRCNAKALKREIEVTSFQAVFIQQGLSKLKNLQGLKKGNQRIWITSPSLHILQATDAYLKEAGASVGVIYPIHGVENRTHEGILLALIESVKSDGGAIGILISECGEEIVLVDETGRVIGQEKYTLLAARLMVQKGATNPIVVPHISSSCFMDMMKQNNIKTIRTKSDPASLMREMLKENLPENELPLQYVLWFNGIWSIGYIIDFLMEEKLQLKDIVDHLPDPYFVKREIQCDWKDKGRVMKEIILGHQKDGVELFEGIKISDEKGWALILPDSEKPLVNVFAEGYSQEYADEISTFYCEKIKNLVGRH